MVLVSDLSGRPQDGGSLGTLVEATPRLRSADHIRLSVAMAAHNEERTIAEAVRQVLAVAGPFELELIVVDDGSTDRTAAILDALDDPRLRVLHHPRCRGKGAAVMSAAAVATGTHILLFDADLEYSADDIPLLVEPVRSGLSSIVYGARVHGTRSSFPSFVYGLGAKATTVFANLAFNSWMSDMHTCLKLMPLRLFRELTLSESGFGLDTEITCEVLRRGLRPFEVPCSYRGRSFAEGKQISARDGIDCLKVVVSVRLRGRAQYSGAVDEPAEQLTVLENVRDLSTHPVPAAAAARRHRSPRKRQLAAARELGHYPADRASKAI